MDPALFLTALSTLILAYSVSSYPSDERAKQNQSQGANSSTSRYPSPQSGNDPIIFPGTYDTAPIVIRPKCTRNESTYCEEVDDYPSAARINDVISKKALEFRHLFGSDEPKMSILHRIDGLSEPTESSLCASRETIVFPKMALNKDSQWQTVVNSEKYKQGIRVELCEDEGKSCQFSGNFPIGYTTSCKQKFTYRTLVAMSPGGEAMTDSFQIPSCCMCMVKIDRLNTRIGGELSRSKVRKN